MEKILEAIGGLLNQAKPGETLNLQDEWTECCAQYFNTTAYTRPLIRMINVFSASGMPAQEVVQLYGDREQFLPIIKYSSNRLRAQLQSDGELTDVPMDVATDAPINFHFVNNKMIFSTGVKIAPQFRQEFDKIIVNR